MSRRRLSPAQKRVIEQEGVDWVGWDVRGRPVISRWGIEFALRRDGGYAKYVYPPVDRT